MLELFILVVRPPFFVITHDFNRRSDKITDSGLSITNWEPIIGAIPPLSNSDWVLAFDQYKLTNEFKIQNFNMDLMEFKVIYWWEWGHRQFGRLIGLFWFIGFIYLLTFFKITKVIKNIVLYFRLPRIITSFNRMVDGQVRS